MRNGLRVILKVIYAGTASLRRPIWAIYKSWSVVHYLDFYGLVLYSYSNRITHKRHSLASCPFISIHFLWGQNLHLHKLSLTIKYNILHKYIVFCSSSGSFSGGIWCTMLIDTTLSHDLGAYIMSDFTYFLVNIVF